MKGFDDNMSYISQEIVSKSRKIDLLTYMKQCEPNELVHLGNNQYCTKEHDSLKISNGKWYWFSRGFGGRSALDYLIKVKQLPFQEAVLRLTDMPLIEPSTHTHEQWKTKEKTLTRPKANSSNRRVFDYLLSRGIDAELIDYCVESDRIYESYPHHNAVFVGTDCRGHPKYAALRGVNSNYKGEASGSDKRYSFSIPSENSKRLHLFESAIDLLSYATLCKQKGCDWRKEHLLSLAGVYQPKANSKENKLPSAIQQYLNDHPEVKRIHLHLDNDRAGRASAEALMKLLSEQYEVFNQPPPKGKDCNEYLCMKMGIEFPRRTESGRER